MKEEDEHAYNAIVYRSFPLPVLVLNTDAPAFTIRFANNAAASLLHTFEQDIPGRAFSDVIFGGDENKQPDWNTCLQEVCTNRQQQKLTGVKVAVATQQPDQYFDVVFTPVINEQDELLYITALITNVTEAVTARKQEAILTAQLNRKEKFLNETEHVSHNGTWEVNLATQQMSLSDMTKDIFETDSAGELNIENSLSFYKDDEQRKALITAVQEAIATGGVFDIESQIVTAKGNPRWIRSTGKAELTSNGATRIYGTTQDITDKKEIERELIDSRNQHEALIRSIDGIVWEADAETFQFSFVSGQVQSILGYTTEEWMNEPDFWSNHIYHEDKDDAISFCLMQTRHARSHTFDYRMIKADGSLVWIKDMVSVITENNKPLLLRGVMVDVTEAKLMEQLDHLEKQVLELNAKKGVETETVLQKYVSGLERLFPTMKCSVLRVKDNKLYDWASESLPRAYIQLLDDKEIGPNAGSCGTAAYLKEKVIASDIETDPRWVNYKHLALPFSLLSCWSYPVLDSGGEVMAVLGVYYDSKRSPDANETDILERSVSILNVILENRLNAETIQEANLLITRGQELADFGTWQWDIGKNKVTWSDVLYKIYGRDKNSFPATFEGYVAMLHVDDRERVMGIIKNVLEVHNDILFEERIIRPNGEERSLRSWGRVILNDEGQPVKMIGACLDITTIKETQTKLEEIGWLQSHVIRAPLARLMGLVDLLQNELAPNRGHDELLSHILLTADELDHVVRNISRKTEG